MHGSRVYISGEHEIDILRQQTPPLKELLKCLNQEGKWKAAHVLLTLRYEKKYSETLDEWNGMNLYVGSESKKEMKKIRAYWKAKLELGQLGQPSPPYPEKMIEYYIYTPPISLPVEAFEESGDLFDSL